VEIISPNDLTHDVEEKVQEYQSAGVKTVWVVSPKSRSVTSYRLGHDPIHFVTNAVLAGEPLFPGFELKVADLFPQKSTAN
jgi:Uma2 family endonuclease